MSVVEIFTDGACSGNPGPGGWGAIIRYKGREEEINGGEPMTTNNRMELLAVIMPLTAIDRPCKIEIYTDSQYVVNGITTWISNWKKNGWRTANNKPVKNEDLWKQLDDVAKKHKISWKWVKGHNGHTENERCDRLAQDGIKRLVGGSCV